ncbi:polyprenyl synthetase [Desulfoplanes formicivorans]|uniref:Polyprenyl synthetase n=2 Tax=Desulfoplanes formicivorans TaxID=1592317 RepID=A0A194AFV6_9BACT|nr:polyprenyl synthetase [Desulfoplanes formicivorans]
MAVIPAIKQELAARGSQVETFLATCLHDPAVPAHLTSAMEYSLLAGGKRLRPVLCLTCAALAGEIMENVLPFAAGIECIHTYSLIHDDLPAMDDDDLRRGKPSSHKQFGEAMAILAGDGLHCEAFTLMLQANVSADRLVAAMRVMAHAAGSRGMVGGQVLDMEYTGRSDISLQGLRSMHAMKTGALIRASCECGVILGGGSDHEQAQVRCFGEHLGLAFQVVDDVLDVVGSEQELGKPVGSDQVADKNTYPRHLGLDASMELARTQVKQACDALAVFHGPHKDFLTGLAEYVLARAC